MTDPVIVAIDGPAGSGKSTVSKAVARRLGYGLLDTGAVYRALAWHVLRSGGDTADEATVLAAADDFAIRIGLDPLERSVRVGDEDVTDAIRTPEVSAAVSGVARVIPVRERVNAMFRQLAGTDAWSGVVIEGRDITTVVAPDAPVRILLTASPEVRAARRGLEFGAADTSEVADALRRRDTSDSNVVDFFGAAEGVEVVDSTELDFEHTVDAVLAVVDRMQGGRDGR